MMSLLRTSLLLIGVTYGSFALTQPPGLESYNQGTTPPATIIQLFAGGGIAKWALIYNDEFSDSTLDTEKWKTAYDWGRNYSPSHYQEWMTDGLNYDWTDSTIHLIAKQESVWEKGIGYLDSNYILDDGGPNFREWNYTSGMLFSKRTFKYGLFEIGCKLPAEAGMWPAFWLVGGDVHEEMDIFEFKGEYPAKYQANVHCPSGCGGQAQWVMANQPLSNYFNSYMGEWGPSLFAWYFNNQDFKVFGGTFDYRKFIIANHGISAIPEENLHPSFSGGPDNTTNFPNEFEIDFIRVWKRIDCPGNKIISGYSQGPQDETAITGGLIELNNATLDADQYLTIVATDSIVINDTTNINGIFETILVDCPDFKSADNRTDYSSNQLVAEEEKPPLFIRIFPNPTSKMVRLEFEGSDDIEPLIKIMNTAGQIVYKQQHESRLGILSIDLSHLNSGIYYLVLEYNGTVVREPIILNK